MILAISPTAGAVVNPVLKCTIKGAQLTVTPHTVSSQYSETPLLLLHNIQKQNEKNTMFSIKDRLEQKLS